METPCEGIIDRVARHVGVRSQSEHPYFAH